MPEVREVGSTPSRRAYAISVRHHERFLEDTPVEQAGAIAPTLTRLLVALYRVPAGPGIPVVWHQGAASAVSWREFLLDGLVDDPGKLVHGWSAVLAGDQELAALSAAVTERVRTLADACPERRDLVHGDLLHGNVLVSPDARRIEAVLSWKCSVCGDFLFDAAWCSYSGDNGGTCVEVGTLGPAVAVRDSNHPNGAQLTFPSATWQTFTTQLKVST